MQRLLVITAAVIVLLGVGPTTAPGQFYVDHTNIATTANAPTHINHRCDIVNLLHIVRRDPPLSRIRTDETPGLAGIPRLTVSRDGRIRAQLASELHGRRVHVVVDVLRGN